MILQVFVPSYLFLFVTILHMSNSLFSTRRNSGGNYRNVIRESDVRADPEYRQKKDFFDQLLIQGRISSSLTIIFVVQMNCEELQQNASREAKTIKDSLFVLISQLSSRVQRMKVSVRC